MSETPTASEPGQVVSMLVQALADSELVLALYDPADRLQWANHRFHDLFLRGLALPVAFTDMLRHGFAHGFGVKIDCGDVEQFLADILRRRRSGPFRSFATDMCDGIWLWMTETLLPSGWLLSSASDITALKHHERTLRQAHAEVVQAAQFDPLTGAASRQHVLDHLRRALDRLDDAQPLSIALVDLDRLQGGNDRFSAQAGDELLVAFVAHCRSRLRPIDAIGRLGREEFLFVFPGLRETLAVRVIERLRAGLSHPAMGPLGLAAGVTQAVPGDTLPTLLQRADSRLHGAKA